MRLSKVNLTEEGRWRGFTLIELLIVVAIIAILAAIAVPNFLEAQTRSKVSRARADLRSIATGLESYRVDNSHYPPTPWSTGDTSVLRVIPNQLSTPIAYISSASFEDPFISANLGDWQYNNYGATPGISTYGPEPADPLSAAGDPRAGRRYYYQSNRDPRRIAFGPDTAAAIQARQVEGEWITASLGPDRRRNLITVGPAQLHMPYDPTNGTISDGDITRTQKESVGSINP